MAADLPALLLPAACRKDPRQRKAEKIQKTPQKHRQKQPAQHQDCTQSQGTFEQLHRTDSPRKSSRCRIPHHRDGTAENAAPHANGSIVDTARQHILQPQNKAEQGCTAFQQPE